MRSLEESPSMISCVIRFAAVSAAASVPASVTPVPSRLESRAPAWAASSIWWPIPCTTISRMLRLRSTARSRTRFAKLSCAAIAPSIETTKSFSRNWGMYVRMPRRSETFIKGGRWVPN